MTLILTKCFVGPRGCSGETWTLPGGWQEKWGKKPSDSIATLPSSWGHGLKDGQKGNRGANEANGAIAGVAGPAEPVSLGNRTLRRPAPATLLGTRACGH